MGGWIYRGRIVARRGGARWRGGKTVGLVGRSMPSGQSGATCSHGHGCGCGRGWGVGDEMCVQRVYVRAGYVYRYLFAIQMPSDLLFLYYRL